MIQGLYSATEQGEYTTYHLLRFYAESQYVIFRSVGDNPDHFRKELLNFKMEGHQVKGKPELTFCGAFQDYGDTVSFKVENEILDPSDSWTQKDVISFKGSVTNEIELELKQTSKRTGLEISRIYLKTTDEEILEKVKTIK